MPRPTRRVYVVRRVVVGAIAAAVLATGFYLPLTLLAPLDSVPAQVLPFETPVAVEVTPVFPSYGASAIGAVGFDGVLARAGATEPQPIASITKIVTALVALDAMPLQLGEEGPSRQLTATDEEYYYFQIADGGSRAYAYQGLTMTQLTMLRLVLMESANNYAQSLADWAFGSQAAFVEAARGWLTANGLTATTITEPTGVDPANTSTTADLVQLGKLALAHPVVASIVATPIVEVPELGVLENSNELIGTDGVDGIKTGTLDEAGACLLFATDVAVGDESVTVVGVVLGGPDHDTINAHIRALLASVLPGFQHLELVAEGEEIARYVTAWGEDAMAVAAHAATVLVWSATPVTVFVEASELALAPQGHIVGQLDFMVDDREITVPIELDDTIDDPGPWWRLTNPALLF